MAYISEDINIWDLEKSYIIWNASVIYFKYVYIQKEIKITFF